MSDPKGQQAGLPYYCKDARCMPVEEHVEILETAHQHVDALLRQLERYMYSWDGETKHVGIAANSLLTDGGYERKGVRFIPEAW